MRTNFHDQVDGDTLRLGFDDGDGLPAADQRLIEDTAGDYLNTILSAARPA
jgi:hypothetical protein